jgi:hypothetical protein
VIHGIAMSIDPWSIAMSIETRPMAFEARSMVAISIEAIRNSTEAVGSSSEAIRNIITLRLCPY